MKVVAKYATAYDNSCLDNRKNGTDVMLDFMITTESGENDFIDVLLTREQAERLTVKIKQALESNDEKTENRRNGKFSWFQ